MITYVTVPGSWDRIEAWFARNALADALRPPAAEADIEAAQATVGLRFPADLVESLRRHDGTTHTSSLIPHRWVLLPLAGIVSQWRWQTEWLAHRQATEIDDMSDENDEDWSEVEEGEEDAFWGWNPGWLPIAADGSGCHLIVDLRPGATYGAVGQLDPECGTRFDGVNTRPSTAALLEFAADALHGIGTDSTPVVRERGVHWTC